MSWRPRLGRQHSHGIKTQNDFYKQNKKDFPIEREKMTTKTKERFQLGRRRRRRVGGGGWSQARGGRDARAPHRCRCSSHPLPSPPPHHPTTTSHPIRALLRSSPIRSARSPSPLPPRDVVVVTAAAARRRRRCAGGGRRRWEVAGLRRGGVLGRAVRGGGRRAVRLVSTLRRAPPLRPLLRAAGVPDPHGWLRLRTYAIRPNPLPSSNQ